MQFTLLSTKNTPVDITEQEALKILKAFMIKGNLVIDENGHILELDTKVDKIKGKILSDNNFTDDDKINLENLSQRIDQENDGLKLFIFGYLSNDGKFYKDRTGKGTEEEPYEYFNLIIPSLNTLYRDLENKEIYAYIDDIRGYVSLIQ